MIYPKFQREIVNNKIPKWLDPSLLPKTEKVEVNLVKTAEEHREVLSYLCPECKKVYSKKDIAIEDQDTSNPVCPHCGAKMIPYKSVGIPRRESPTASYKQMLKETNLKTASGTYNTFVDRQLYWKTLSALQKHAQKAGMFGAQVRYQSSDHIMKAGQQYPMANNFNYLIEWQYGMRQGNVLTQKKKVTATVVVDAAGNIQLPKVFATLDGREYPFDKASIQELERIPSPPSAKRSPKMTDTLTFRQMEVSRTLHSFNFATAALDSDVITKREVNGRLHNEAGPAVIHKDGSEEYWVNGELHREDGPAVVGADGFKAYFIHGLLHNANAPAVIYPNGNKEYWFKGKFIRQSDKKRDIPRQFALEGKNLGKVGFDFYNETVPGFHHKETDENGSNYYFDNENRLHRTDGPAVEHANGQGEYYVNGQKMSPEQHQQYVQKMEAVAKLTDTDHIVEALMKKSDKLSPEVQKAIEKLRKSPFHKYTIQEEYYGHYQVGGAYKHRKTINAPDLVLAFCKYNDFTIQEYIEQMMEPDSEDDIIKQLFSDDAYLKANEYNFENEEFSYVIQKDGKTIFSGGGEYEEEEEETWE